MAKAKTLCLAFIASHTALQTASALASPSDPKELVSITLHPQRLRTLDPAYLSVALDTALVLKGEWWQSDTPIDLQHPRFLALSQFLTRQAPTYLRVGGTDADRVLFRHTPPKPHAPTHLPYEPARSKKTKAPTENTPQALTPLSLHPAHWSSLQTLAKQLQTPLVFTLNAGPLQRETPRTDWNPENAAQLMAHAEQHRTNEPTASVPMKSWELGNEPNGYPLFFKYWLSGNQYAKDLKTFRSQFPQTPLAGPATAWWPVWGEPLNLSPDILKQGGQFLDYLTWHYYPQQSRRCGLATRPAQLNTLLDPRALDTAVHFAERIERQRRRYSIQARHWLGETGHAQCGGEPGLSDRWVSSLWWLDQLGALARVGVDVQIRQALVGSDYGLLDSTSYAPRPDFWSSALWKQLMGPEVLSSQITTVPKISGASRSQTLRHYAHCHPRQGVTLLHLNLSASSQPIYLPYPVANAQEYILSASHLRSPTVQLNGQPIVEAKVLQQGGFTGQAPAPNRQGYFQLPPHSAQFLHLPDFQATGCPSHRHPF